MHTIEFTELELIALGLVVERSLMECSNEKLADALSSVSDKLAEAAGIKDEEGRDASREEMEAIKRLVDNELFQK